MTQWDLAALKLVDAPLQHDLDRIAEIVIDELGVPISVVSMVEPERDRQYFAGRHGIPADLFQTPLSHSFCKHVHASGQPLVVCDARQHALVADCGAIAEFGILSYLGVPVRDPDGTPIGAVCAMSRAPRDWTQQDLARMWQIGAFVDDQVRMRSAVLREREALRDLRIQMHIRARFFERVTHQLRTPLNGIAGLLDVMGPTDLGDPAFVARLRAACEDMVTATGALLDHAEAPPDRLDGAPNFLGLKVLIADDHPTNLFILGRMLGTLSVETVAVGDGLSAVAAAAADRFDAAFLDISMPGLSGVEAMRAIRSGPQGAMPVIAVSAHVRPEQIATYLDCGFDGFVAKPVRRETLVRALRRMLDKPVAGHLGPGPAPCPLARPRQSG